MSLLDRLRAAAPLLTLFAAAWLVAWLAERHAAHEELDPGRIGSAATWLGAGALVGARLGYLLPRWQIYRQYPLDVIYVQSGLSFYGGLAGALVVVAWYARRGGLPFGRTVDLFAPQLALGIAAYRFLCLFRGDCGGALAAPPFGVVFPGFTRPRCPVEPAEAVLALAVFGLLRLRAGRLRFPGELSLLFLAAYPLVRAAVDFFRINLDGWPTADQVVSVVVAAAAATFWWLTRSVVKSAGHDAQRHG